jgi:DNA-binding transcriptional regulator YdaS (Cro superfamily)
MGGMGIRKKPLLEMTPLEKAIRFLGGYSATARVCGVASQVVSNWVRRGHLPRTEWTGETNYSARIEEALAGAVPREEILSVRPSSSRTIVRER